MIRTALLQMPSSGTDQKLNRKTAEEYCRKAAAEKADIALFPEMFNIGYTFPEERTPESIDAWHSHAVDPEGEWVGYFRGLAKELNMAVCCTYLEKRKAAAPANSLSLFDRNGNTVLRYRKVHTCRFMPFEASLSKGDSFSVADLDLAGGNVRVGTMICWDREFPESARTLMLGGAELVLVPNAARMDVRRLSQLQSGAFGNAMALGLANYPGQPFGGGSVAYGCDGNKIAEAGVHEEIVLFDLDMEYLRTYRKESIRGNAYRRPEVYGLLVKRNG